MLICFAFTFWPDLPCWVCAAAAPNRAGAGSIGRVRNLVKSVLATAIMALAGCSPWPCCSAHYRLAVSTQAEVRTEVGQLCLPAPRSSGICSTWKDNGASGEIDLIVRAPDVTDPAVVVWTDEVRNTILNQSGYDTNDPSCEGAELCPGRRFPDFVDPTARGLTSADIRGPQSAPGQRPQGDDCRRPDRQRGSDRGEDRLRAPGRFG